MFAELIATTLLGASIPAETPPQNPDHAEWMAQCEAWDEWDKPGPPYKIIGNTYYVGTCGISAILITSDDGHVLIDTGTRQGAEVVAQNIQRLGFRLADIKGLLSSHEHHDHVGGHEWMRKQTGATVIALQEAASVLATGKVGSSDPQFGVHPDMEPVLEGTVLADGEIVTVGKIELRVVATPGHTPGAASWTWTDCEGAVCARIVYADSLSPVSGDSYNFSNHPEYVAAYRAGLEKLRKLECEIILTPHPSSSKMPERLAGPTGLLSPDNCDAYPDLIEARLDKRLAEEAAE